MFMQVAIDNVVSNAAAYIHKYSFNNQLTRTSDTIKSKMIKQMKIMNSIK